MLRRLSAVLLLASLSGFAASAAEAPASASTDQLATQARYWEVKGRYDLARDSWLKLLRNSPDNAAALSGLALAEAKSGRSAAAQVYLDRLKESHPDSPDINRIEAAIKQGSYDQDRLSQPRALARDGKYDEALRSYQQIFGSEIPGSRLGLEYYQTQAGATGGWEPARAGIEKLVKDNGDDPIYRLAYAQHLTYREETRRTGIAQLAELSGNPSVATPAKQAWRQALLWLGPKPADEKLYDDYLKRYGADAEVSQRFASARAGTVVAADGTARAAARAEDPKTGQVREAYAKLNDSEVDAAGTRFETLLARYPNDVDSLGGLGIVRLREQRFGEARSLLERASQLAPKSSARWKDALSTARFWERVRHGEAAREAGDLTGAERDFRAAIAADPRRADQEPSVRIALADVLVEQGRFADGEKQYREVLRRQPDNTDAQRGLIGVLARSNRLPEALALADRLPADQRAKLGNFGSLKAQYLRDQATRATADGDALRAEGLLKDALLLDPDNAYTRMDLARIYQKQRRTREANTLIDGILASNPGNADALFVKALLLGDQQDWYNGLLTLEQISPGSRTPAMNDLQKRLWVRYQTQRAGVYARYGQQQQALNILAEVEPYVGTQPELLGALANAYADTGDEGRALRYMRQALARQGNVDAGTRLAYAGLLFKVRQDAEFEVVMEDLLRRGGLNEQQNLDLANLRVGYRLRQADLVREEGDLARAYEYLEPLIKVNPNDPRVLMALARLYNDAKDYDRAYAINQRVLAQDPNNIDALKGAIGSALARNDLDTADDLIARAMRLEPENPRLYALAGRAARARGQDGRAVQLLQRALQLESQGRYDPGAVPGTSSPQLYLIDPATRDGSYPGSAALRPMAYHPHAKTASPRFYGWMRADRRGLLALAGTSTTAAARLIKTAAQADAQVPPPESGYWVPQGNAGNTASYVYQPRTAQGTAPALTRLPAGAPEADVPPPSTTTRRATSARAADYAVDPSTRSEFPPPRRLTPSTELSRPSSFQRETQQQIDDINAQSRSGSARSAAPARPSSRAYEVPRSDANGAASASPYYAPPPVTRGYGYDPVGVPPPSMPPRSTSTLRVDPLLSTPDFVLNRRQPANATERDGLLKEIDEIQSKRSAFVEGGLAVRSRDGQSGLERLTDTELPIEASLPSFSGGSLKLRIVPVYLDAGTVSGQSLPRFGTLALVNNPSLSFDQNQSGAAVGVGYEAGSFRADIGSSPLGFPVENLIGGIKWSPSIGRTTFRIDLSRRAVTDSLLSYAGTRDPGLGRDWGGVTKTGGRLDIAYDLGRYGVYANGGYHVYDGKNVAQNTSYELGAGLYARAYESRAFSVTYGLNVSTFFYDKNLRYFTYGHGGYFSPQQYYSFGVPVEVVGGSRRLSYQLKGALGLQAFKEDGQGLYPNDSNLQVAIAAASLADPTILGGYSSKSSTGVGFNFSGSVEYLLDPNLIVGGRVAVDNARDYNEAVGLGYIRFMFSRQAAVPKPPMTLYPFYDYGDPNL